MASHRKPSPSHRRPRPPHPLTGNAARAALTLTLAGTAGSFAFEGSGHADPRQTPEQTASQVDALHRQAERATERHNAAEERSGKAEDRLEELRDETARDRSQLNAARDTLGSYATAQYRTAGLDPSLQVALSSSPDDYLDRAAVTERAGERQSATVRKIAAQAREVRQLRDEAAATERTRRHATASARAHKRTVEDKLAQAEKLLDRLSPEDRARALGEEPPAGARASRSDGAAGADAGRDAVRPGQAAGRAVQAVDFARGALGKPYVWGATGPGSYDCSGLTQAAWKAAGVSLPRTTYAQIDAGKRVSRDQLAPGDLVFFYESVSHVGLYTGGGTMIHAPRPGAPIRVAPIDEMPFSGAMRPA